MSEEPDPIVGALRDLLQSEGWRLLREQAVAEWVTGYGHRMKEALATIPHGPDRPYELARVAEQVDATSNAVNALVMWPTEEIKRRTEPQSTPLASVRDRMLATMSRPRRRG